MEEEDSKINCIGRRKKNISMVLHRKEKR